MTIMNRNVKRLVDALARPRRNRRPRALDLRLETLESIELLSTATKLLPTVPALVQSAAVSKAQDVMATKTTAPQTVTVPQTLTNFAGADAIPFTPAIDLFNPALGQLVAVHITATTDLNSQFVVTNTSPNPPAAVFQGQLTGATQIDGLGFSLANSQTQSTASLSIDPGQTVSFPNLNLNYTQTFTLTDPASLAYFTAKAGTTQISPVLGAIASATSLGPPGNTTYTVTTTGQGSLTISYDYTCPPLTSLVRFGIHHQPTQLQLTYAGQIDATDAQKLSNYWVIKPNADGSFTGPGVTYIPISAVTYAYDAATNTTVITLTTARQLNVHYKFELAINLACYGGTPNIVPFGTIKSLGGFWYHGTHFVRGADGRFIPG